MFKLLKYSILIVGSVCFISCSNLLGQFGNLFQNQKPTANLLAAPETVTVIPSDQVLTVTWEKVAGATHYEVWLNTNDTRQNAIQIEGNTNDTSSVATGLTNGQEYFVWVRANAKAQKNTKSLGVFSDPASGTPFAPLYPPGEVDFELAPEDGTLIVTWEAVDGASSYEVYYGLSDDFSSATFFNDPNPTDLTAIITGLDNNTDYYVWVVAKNDVGSGPVPEPESETPNLQAPQSVTLTPADQQLSVSWDDVNGATGYEVYFYTDNDLPSATLLVEGDSSDTFALVDSLINDTEYYVWVRATNGVDSGLFSSAENETPYEPVLPPASPAAPTALVNSGSLDLSWSAVSGATSYEVWFHTSNDSASAVHFLGDTDTSDTTASLTGLTNGTPYYVWLRAVNSAGTSGFSAVSSETPLLPAPTGANLAVSGGGEITVTWDTVADAEDYEVWFNTTDDVGGATIFAGDLDTTDTSAIVDSLPAGEHFFWIRGTDSTSNGIYTDAGNITVLYPPGVPTNINVTAQNGELDVNYDAVSGADTYQVFFNTTNDYASATLYGGDPDDTDTFTTVTGLTNGQEYYIWVNANNAAGASSESIVASETPLLDTPVPGSITVGPGSIDVNWAVVSGATEYEVWYNTVDDTGTATLFGSDPDTTDTTATIDGLANVVTYVWIRALDGASASNFSPAGSFTPEEDLDGNWSYRYQLTLDNSFGGSDDLSDFPILVHLNGQIDWAKIESDGSDLRFTDASGSQLAFEIEEFDYSNNAYIWVKVPSIDAGTSTETVWVYYGNNSVAGGEDPEAVWTNGFIGVYHLNVKDSDTYYDSTALNNHGDADSGVNPTGGYLSDGVLVYNQGIDISDVVDDANTTNGTITGWVRPNNASIVQLAATMDMWGFKETKFQYRCILAVLGVCLTGWEDLYKVGGDSHSENVSPNNWYMLAESWDNSDIVYYENGAQAGTDSGSASLGDSAFIGSFSGAGILSGFFGTMDEIRFASVTRSSGWIEAEYRNQHTGSSFVVFTGTEENL